jgi:hypothetical protein
VHFARNRQPLGTGFRPQNFSHRIVNDLNMFRRQPLYIHHDIIVTIRGDALNELSVAAGRIAKSVIYNSAFGIQHLVFGILHLGFFAGNAPAAIISMAPCSIRHGIRFPSIPRRHNAAG